MGFCTRASSSPSAGGARRRAGGATDAERPAPGEPRNRSTRSTRGSRGIAAKLDCGILPRSRAKRVKFRGWGGASSGASGLRIPAGADGFESPARRDAARESLATRDPRGLWARFAALRRSRCAIRPGIVQPGRPAGPRRVGSAGAGPIRPIPGVEIALGLERAERGETHQARGAHRSLEGGRPIRQRCPQGSKRRRAWPRHCADEAPHDPFVEEAAPSDSRARSAG